MLPIFETVGTDAFHLLYTILDILLKLSNKQQLRALIELC